MTLTIAMLVSYVPFLIWALREAKADMKKAAIEQEAALRKF